MHTPWAPTTGLGGSIYVGETLAVSLFVVCYSLSLICLRMHVHSVIGVLCGSPIEDIGEGVSKLL